MTLLGVAGIAPVTAVAEGDGAAAAPSADPATRVAVARDACGPILRKRNGSKWHCSFVDNFNGSSLNRDKWTVQQSTKNRYATGLTCYMDSRDNVRVGRGTLKLTTRKQSLFLCGLHRAFLTNYTGGLVGTRGHFSQTYGRFEIRAKYPASTESGLHGGFWMNPIENIYGKWPASGEMDVSEWWSFRPHLSLPSLHFNGRDKWVDSGWHCKVHDATRFHRYRVLWRPTIMRFFINGRLCFARRWTPDAPQRRPQPFDHPFGMILNMGVTRHSGAGRITDDTEFPSTFVVDYAKAWR